MRELGLPEEEVILARNLVEIMGISDSIRKDYDIIEFATALKPALLIYLLRLGYNSVIFLDPDIRVYSSLELAFNIAEEFGVAVTPHRLTPTDSSIDTNYEVRFLKYGIHNLGFVAVGKKGVKCIEWWLSKTLVLSDRKFFLPQFTDQKWTDFFPSYFDAFLLRHSGYNVAPWNYDEREISVQNGSLVTKMNEKLVFIHFSQNSHISELDSLNPLWRETSSGDIPLSDFNTLTKLLKNYRAELDKYLEILPQYSTRRGKRGFNFKRSYLIQGAITGASLDRKRFCSWAKKLFRH
jgi:hypothetical protein